MTSPAVQVSRRRNLLPGWRVFSSRVGTRLNGMSYLSRWLVLAGLIGVIAGIGAVAFYEALRLATHLLLGAIGGYHPSTPAGEGGSAGSAGFSRPWAIPLVVALGGLISGVLVFTWAPEAEGHGTDAAIEAVHENPRGIRLRAVVVKIVASAVTIGSGGSGGREGPTAQISAGFGSLLARALDLSPDDGRIAVSVGIGSGIGAIFSAPLGGAVLASDVVYRDDFEFRALVPGLFASIVAYVVFGAVLGYRPLFHVGSAYVFRASQLPWFAAIGILAGGIGLLYSKSFYLVVRLSRRLPMPRALRPALGGLLVGLIALRFPEVLGTGYGWIQQGLSGGLVHSPLLLVLALPLVRILATDLSIGTGGSGGVFGPGMVIGAATGLAVWRLGVLAGGVGHDAVPFIIVGMMAVFGGISRAPLAVMIMVAEMTANVAVIAPALVAVAIATFVVGLTDDSIYRSQLRTRADSAAGRLQFAMPLLSTLTVGEVGREPLVVFREETTAVEALEQLHRARVPGAPVVDADGLYVGAVEAESLERAAEQKPEMPVTGVLDPTAVTMAASGRASTALDALMQAGGRWVTVTGESRRVVGVVAVSDVVRGYRLAVGKSLGQLARVSAKAVVVEERVGAQAAARDVPLRRAPLPTGAIVMSVQRGRDLIFPSGATELSEGDIVSVLTPEAARPEVVKALRGSGGGEGRVASQEGQLV